jgi:hypothetical protein
MVAFLLLYQTCLWIGCSTASDHVEQDNTVSCTVGPASETDGHRRLALIVGVGEYKSPDVRDLSGPPNDARRFHKLLTDPRLYRFPEQNVCLLIDRQATTARFKEMFQKGLVDRAQAGDVAVVFFSGHGSIKRDLNYDESGEWDQTIMFHDARTGGVGDLVDDEFNQLLGQLYEKTKHIVVITDSCHSGTVTRGDFVARFEPEDKSDAAPSPDLGGDGAYWVPETMPGIVVMSAASDDSVALERDGRGLFTEALWQVMSRAYDSNRPLTYAQVSRQVPPLIAAQSYQIPYFHGDLNQAVFGNAGRIRPIGWDVKKMGPPIELSGPPWPGIGKGAELRIYDGAVTGSDSRDPSKAKATVVIDAATGVNATAHVVAARPGAPELVEGDLAILARPGDDYLGIKVRLRPAGEPGGIARDRAKFLENQVRDDPEARMFVNFVDDDWEFELSVASDNKVVLTDTAGRPRNFYASDTRVAKNLWQHARQRALRQLQGETGADYVNDETLQVQLIPSRKQLKCADGIWEQSKPFEEQIIPMCHAWNVKVTMKAGHSPPLLVGGVVLSTDGSTFAFPVDGRQELLKGGDSVIFNAKHETFVAAPPLDVQDQVIVFGTQETNRVAWHLLTSTAKTRSGKGPPSALYRALDRYLQPGQRGAIVKEEDVEDTTWTTSSVAMRVEANSRFLKPGTATTPQQLSKEYTIKNFDIRPYLPYDNSTALYRVLKKADNLARASIEDGYGYKQHDWSLPTDEENLKKGIDCSRSIWFAFKSVGLPYNRENRYLSTAMMVGENTWMKDEFENCSDDSNLKLGDVIVYRDDTRGDGHVVMVIDPAKRIAWGSHGWDGSARELKIKPDTGVEYQLIKYKKDWERWDRSTMRRKACWRYRKFIAEAQTAGGQPGLSALDPAIICDPDMNCGNPTETQ